MTTPIPITHNAALHRFEALTPNEPLAYVSYTKEDDRVVFDHTYVPDSLRGKGMAAALVGTALREAKKQGWRIEPRCSYVAAFVKRNPEFADLVD